MSLRLKSLPRRTKNVSVNSRSFKAPSKPPLAKDARPHSRSISRRRCGLKNLGNTCYMNSILQCLLHTPRFQDYFSKQMGLDLRADSNLKGQLALHFQKLMEANKSAVCSPTGLKHLAGKISSQFIGNGQHDAAEFLRYFLEGLHLDLNRVRGKPAYKEMSGDYLRGVKTVADEWWNYSLDRDSSVVTDVFQGQLLSVITCTHCTAKSLSCDSFLDLSLPLTGSDLQQCFDAFTQETKVPSYRCEKCKKTGHCIQGVSLYRLPQVLAIQLKRFTVVGNKREKLTQNIAIPGLLSVKDFSYNRRSRAEYRLYAVAHHMGGLSFGHYVADCLDAGNWHCYDDSRVSITQSPSSSRSAYILFYNKI